MISAGIKERGIFYKDERILIEDLKNAMPEITETCIAVKLSIEKNEVEIYYPQKEKLQKQIIAFKEKLEELRENIWEESDPDE